MESNGDYWDNIVSPIDFLTFYHEAKSVTNVGVGFKHKVSPTFVLLGGFRTDFTSASRDNPRFINDKFKINQPHMDKYHFTLGPVYKIKRLTLATGFQYTYGSTKKFNSYVNFVDPVEYNPQTMQSLEGAQEAKATINIKELALFFGISIDLVKVE